MTFCELPQEQNYPGNLDIQNSLCPQNKGIASPGSIPMQQAASSNLHFYTTAGCSGMPSSGISQSVGRTGISGNSTSGSTCQNNSSGSPSGNSNSSGNNDMLHSMLCGSQSGNGGQGDNAQKQGANQFVDSRKADGEVNMSISNAEAHGATIIVTTEEPKGSPGEGNGRVTTQLPDGSWASVIYGGSQSGEKNASPPATANTIMDAIPGAAGGAHGVADNTCTAGGCVSTLYDGTVISVQPSSDGSGFTATQEYPNGDLLEIHYGDDGKIKGDVQYTDTTEHPRSDAGDNKSPKPDDSGPPSPFILYLTAALQKDAGPNTGQSQNIDYGDLNNGSGNNNNFKPQGMNGPSNIDYGPDGNSKGIEITTCKIPQNHIDCTRTMGGEKGPCSGMNPNDDLIPKPQRPQKGGGGPKPLGR